MSIGTIHRNADHLSLSPEMGRAYTDMVAIVLRGIPGQTRVRRSIND